MICLPPRVGKSFLGSVHAPAHFIGNHPEQNIISICNTEPLAKKWGQDVRNIIRGDAFGNIFPGVGLAPDAQAAGHWRTRQGGGYYAMGVTGSVMGRGADMMIIDDPYKSYEDAQSEAIRDEVFSRYQNTFLNRMEPGGRIVLINHRMAADDLCGRLQEKMRDGTGDAWDVVEFPALDEEGESVCPERLPTRMLLRLKKNMNPLVWSSLFMQDPAPADGKYYKSHWVQRYDADTPLPPMTIFGASDYAVTDVAHVGSLDRDYTEHGVFGVDAQARLWVLDWWYGQTEPDEWVRAQVEMMKRWKPFLWGGESGIIMRATAPSLSGQMIKEGVFVRLEWLPSIRDKVVRSTSFQGLMSMYRVMFPKTEWADRIVHQMLQFPGGRHDDACDVLSLAGRMFPNVPRGGYQRTKTAAEHLDEIANKRYSLDELWKFAALDESLDAMEEGF